MSEQFNIRLPAKTRRQVEQMQQWSGMDATKLTIEALDHLYQEYKQEYAALPGWYVYRRDLNAGFVTQTILVKDGIIVDSYEAATQRGSDPGDWPNLNGQSLDTLRGKGFTRVKNEREVETFLQKYLQREEII